MKKSICFIAIALQTAAAAAQWVMQFSPTPEKLNDIHAISMDTVIAVGDMGTIIRTIDGGINWNIVPSGVTDPITSVHFPDNNTGYAVTQTGIVIKSVDKGASWFNASTLPVNPAFGIHFADPAFGYTCGSGITGENVMITGDGSASWGASGFGLNNPLFSIFSINVSMAFTVGVSGNIYNTIDAGSSWVSQFSGTTKDLRSVYFADPNHGYAAGDTGIFVKTNDGGNNWTNQQVTPVNLKSVFFMDTINGWVAGENGVILKTMDGGNTWFQESTPTTDPLNAVFFRSGAGYAVGINGIILKLSPPPPCQANFGFTTSSLTANFTDSSTTSNPPIMSWSWDFGDGFTGTAQNPSHTYSSGGTYNVCLTISDMVSCTNTICKTVSVSGGACQANFGFTTSSLTANFTDSSTTSNPPIMSWSWDFGDGFTGTAQNPSHTYSSGGTYNVCLTITDMISCTNTICKTVSVSGGACQANFGFTTSSLTALFTDSSTTSNPPIMSWSWNFNGDSITDATIPNPTWTFPVSGTYNVCLTISDTSGCTNTICKTVSVTSGGGCMADFFFTTSSLTASFTNNSTTANPPITSWSWDFNGDFVTDANLPNPTWTYISSGTYNVCLTITDSSGCSDSACKIVTVTGSGGCIASFSYTVDTMTYTANFVDGSTSSSGIISSWTWDFGDGQTGTGQSPTHTYTVPITDPYNVCLTITDTAGCTDSFCQSVCVSGGCPPPHCTNGIMDYDETGIDCGGIDCVPCGGGCTADFTFFADTNLTVYFSDNSTTGNPPLTSWNWNFGDSTTSTIQSPSHVYGSPGTYSACLTITDSSGCSNTYCQTITVSGGGCTANITSFLNASCFGACDGQATVAISGGTSPYTFSWNTTPVQTGATATGLCAGTYMVTVTDAGGITCTASATIGQPSSITTSMQVTNLNCNGVCNGTATVSIVSGGIPPFTYIWSTTPAQTTATATGLCAGPASNYMVTITDADGCTANTGTLAINEPVALTVNITGSDETCIGCCDGSATANVTGGTGAYTYSWNTSPVQTTATAAGLCAGGYTLTVTDSNGCSTTNSVTIGSPACNITASIVGTDVSCSGNCDGAADLTVSNGTAPYTYAWSNAAVTEDLTNLCAGVYTVTVTDAVSCAATGSVTISASNTLTAVITGVSPAPCLEICDGIASAFATGGTQPYTYLWNDPLAQTSSIANNLCAGTYIVMVTDAAGCSDTASATVTSNPEIILTVNTVNSSCGNSDGSATVTVSNGTSPYDYQWSSGDTLSFADSLASGFYIVTVTDDQGCFNFANVTISDANGPVITGSSVTEVTCNGNSDGAIIIGVAGGTAPYTYQWSNGNTTQNISNLVAGPYEVTITDAAGCVATQSITVTQPDALSLSVSKSDATCGNTDASATVNVSGGTSTYTYSWSTGGNTSTETGLGAGVYVVTVTDANGCIDSAAVAISNAGGPIITVDSIIDITCDNPSGGSIYITVTGGDLPYNYLWSNNDVTEDIINVPGGNYNITVTDSAGCLATASMVISGISPAGDSICIVTVDSATGKNLIVWEKTMGGNIQSYNIYKESTQAGIYYLIGSQEFNAVSIFTDSLSDPTIRSWRYKISSVDSCGNESALSKRHKTMHLTINQGLSNTVNLIWDHYQGFDFGSYYIHRYTTSTGWEEVDSMASTLTSWTDPSPPGGNISYRVVVKHPSGCNPSKKADDYNSSRSNTSIAVTTGIIRHAESGILCQVYPNPGRGVFTLEIYGLRFTNYDLKIFDILGREIKKSEVRGQKTEIDLSGQPAGIYHLQLVTGKGIVNMKVVIE